MEVHMNITKEILKRATVQGLADYLLYGEGTSTSCNNPDLKLEKAFEDYEKQLKELDTNSIQLILDISNNLASEVAEVYTALGLKAGFLIALDLLQNTEL